MMNTLSGRWVFDSNILIYGLDRSSSLFKEVQALFATVREGQVEVVLSQQNITETIQAFVKGYRKSPVEVIKSLNGLIAELEITVISPISTTYQRFFELLSRVNKPIDVYDYYLAATMLDNGIKRILTANDKDFSQIKEIEAVNPFV